MIQISNYSSLLQEGFIPTAFSWNSSHAITARNLKLNENFNYKNLLCREKDCFFPLGKGEKCKMFLALN